MKPDNPVKKNPVHVAIIMDGNGRWAKRRGLNRSFGHKEGQKTLEKVIKWCIKRNVKYLTVYAFSTENWKRPYKEVSFLMNLLENTINKKIDDLIKQDIHLNIYGSMQKVPKRLVKNIQNALKLTEKNKKFFLNIAFNYGGKDEIVRAVNKLIKNKSGRTLKITEEIFRKYLDHPEIPDPDLLIRTGGESRISNFLLWEISYTELYFTKTLWPDFSEKDLDRAFKWYKNRDRRFGGL